MSRGSGEAAAPGLAARMLTAWGDLRGAMRAVLDARPSESTLLVFALLSGVFQFLGRLAALTIGPEAGVTSSEEMPSRLGAEFTSAIGLRTLGLYLVAWLVHAVSRAAGGAGAGRDSRAAVFWAALVAAPVLLLAEIVSFLIAPSVGSEAAEGLPFAAGLAFAWAAAASIAEAHGFRSTVRVLAALAAPALILVGAGLFLGAETGG